jgi:bloom syndrome protein
MGAYSQPACNHWDLATKVKAIRRTSELFNNFPLSDVQEQAVLAALDNKNVFLRLRTGGGKTECFRIPAVLQGLTVIYVPTKALMEDLTKRTFTCGAAFLHADQTRKQVKQVWADLHKLIRSNKGPRLLFVAPERYAYDPGFRNLLSRLYHAGKLKRFGVDEAHCVLDIGSRKAYNLLGQCRREFPDVPWTLATGTCTLSDRNVILSMLDIPECECVDGPLSRPELAFKVLQRAQNVETQLTELVVGRHTKTNGSDCTLIFGTYPAELEEWAETLRKIPLTNGRNLRVGVVHGKKKQNETPSNTDVIEAANTNQLDVMLANEALGVGVDLRLCHYVIFIRAPLSLTKLAQGGGRAGRDGSLSEVVVLYSVADLKWGDTFLTGKYRHSQDSWAQRLLQVTRKALREVVLFCESKLSCRSLMLLDLTFANKMDQLEGCQCDNCESLAALPQNVQRVLINASSQLKIVLEAIDASSDGMTVERKELVVVAKKKGLKMSDPNAHFFLTFLVVVGILHEDFVYGGSSGKQLRKVISRASGSVDPSVVESFELLGKTKTRQ